MMKKKSIQNKKSIKKPLERHKILIKKMMGNSGKPVSLAKAMKEVGYSDNYANNPQEIKKTRSWDILMKEVLNDELLAEKHSELLNKKEIFNIDGELVKSGQPHSDVKGALDMGYKLKSKYAPEEFNMKFKGFNKDQLIDLIMSKITKKK